FTVLMALVHPHPALRAAIPICPMVDGWRGDDWFHNGAFRQTNFDYLLGQETQRGEGKPVPRPGYADYDNFRRAGSAGDFAHATVYETGSNAWRRLPRWPLACASGCPSPLRSLYLLPGGRAGFTAPTAEGFDEYVSDPAKPVPYIPRPVRFADHDAWRTWLV